MALSGDMTDLDFSSIENSMLGSYEHTVDGKGRLIIPSKLRSSLGDRFFVTIGLDHCLFAYNEENWLKFQNHISSLPLSKKDARRLQRSFFAMAADVTTDKQGRILIPAKLREYAGLDKDVVLLGLANRVEIWSKERYEDYNDFEDSEDALEEVMEKFNFGGGLDGDI